MGQTIYDQAAFRVTTEEMRNPEQASVIAMYFRQLHDGEYPPSYRDVIFQKFGRFPIDIFDARSFAGVHASIRTGRVAIFQIPVGIEPCADKRIEEMNKRLSGIPEPFNAEFWGGTADYDGTLKWDRPVNALLNNGQDELGYVIMRPSHVGLEVGYVSSHKMHVFLNLSNGIARWPYGQKYITVLMRLGIVTASDFEFENLRKNVWGGDYYLARNPYEADWNHWKDGKYRDICEVSASAD